MGLVIEVDFTCRVCLPLCQVFLNQVWESPPARALLIVATGGLGSVLRPIFCSPLSIKPMVLFLVCSFARSNMSSCVCYG